MTTPLIKGANGFFRVSGASTRPFLRQEIPFKSCSLIKITLIRTKDLVRGKKCHFISLKKSTKSDLSIPDSTNPTNGNPTNLSK